jgi:hypothetical protein
MKLTGETEELGEKPVPVSLRPPQTPHGLTRTSAGCSRTISLYHEFYDIASITMLDKSVLEETRSVSQTLAAVFAQEAFTDQPSSYIAAQVI